MRLEDLGIDVRTKQHNRTLTKVESHFVGLLWTEHVGADRALPANVMALMFNNGYSERVARNTLAVPNAIDRYAWTRIKRVKRNLRTLQNHILKMHDHLPVMSKAGRGGGYWISGGEHDASAFYDTFRARGITGLVKASRGRQADLVEMIEQVSFEFEDATGTDDALPAARSVQTPAAVVDKFLDKMLRQPDRFAADLKKISNKFAGVLLPKARAAAISKKARELQELVAGMG